MGIEASRCGGSSLSVTMMKPNSRVMLYQFNTE